MDGIQIVRLHTYFTEIFKHIRSQEHIGQEVDIMIISHGLTADDLPHSLSMLVLFLCYRFLGEILIEGFLRR